MTLFDRAQIIKAGQKTPPLPVEIVRRYSAATFIESLLTLPLNTWFIMLLLGALHSDLPHVPALGYVDVLIILVIASFTVLEVRPVHRAWHRKGGIS
jgi:hypothetical protein